MPNRIEPKTDEYKISYAPELKCSGCHDPLTTDDNDSNLCGACADSLKAERDRLLKENANLNDWLKTWKESFNIAQAEITKLKQPVICAKCNDHIMSNDGAICETCAQTNESIIQEFATMTLDEFALWQYQLRNTKGGLGEDANRL